VADQGLAAGDRGGPHEQHQATSARPPVNGADVERAVAEMARALRPHAGADWDVPAGDLEWSCRRTAAHVAHDLTAYAGQIAAEAPDDYLPFDLEVRPGTPPGRILDVVVACGHLLSTALAAAGPATRAWHWGPTDVTGFAAMGVTETLMHTWDITRGLDVDWRPPADLCAAVTERLFPDAPGGDPADALLWCTGRIALPERPRRTSWVMKAAVV
jgi:Mycothiol maleylpyruvate isomerase N-terminal domain